MTRDDGRRIEAKAIPILEVAGRLGIARLVHQGAEHVGPCPVCGGRRDRLQINPARGLFICRGEDAAGDGLALVQHVLGCDFRAALDFLVGTAETAPDPAEIERRRARLAAEDRRRAETEAALRARAIRDARETWGAAVPGAGTAAETYLAARGVTFPAGWPPTLRFLPGHPAVKRIDGASVELHRGPCMVAAIQGPDGRVRAVHQTWIDPARPGRKAAILLPDGSPAPAKMVRGSKKGGAIRLTAWGTSGTLIMGEGIETTGSALAAGVRPAAAFWAGIDLGNMAGRQVRVPGRRHSGVPDLEDGDAFLPPEGTRHLVFIQDGDSDPTATRAKLLAGIRRAMAQRPGLKGWIVPAADGRDLNDMRMEQIEA